MPTTHHPHLEWHVYNSNGIHEAGVDASDLGWKPGEWPVGLWVTLKDGSNVYLDKVPDAVTSHPDGEFEGHQYVDDPHAVTVILTVYND